MFINFWYVAARSEELSAERPIRRRMLGHDFALWRDSGGAAHCVSNTCSHRSGALGGGRLNGDCVECPYHGWTFDGAGNCVRIPSLGKDARIPERTRIDAYPVQEKYGLVHVFLGDLPEAERPPIIDLPEWGDPAWYVQTFTAEWKIDYKRSVENTLDPAHNEFVHDTHGFSGRNDDYRVAPLAMSETPWGSGFMVPMYSPRLPDERMHKVSGRADASWAEGGSGNHGPNVTWTYIHLSPQARFHNFTFHTPVDAITDRITILMFRGFMQESKFDADFEKRFWHVAEQDRVVLEAMAPVMTPEHNRYEYLVPSDGCVARYRELCKDWEARGWRLDTRRIEADAKTVAYAIPGPARRERPRGWVLPAAPLRKAAARTAAAALARTVDRHRRRGEAT
jgi:phenylpropionate dioxygenase-like ring-hydroxylating dioxygenase large terminal subunit